VSPRYLDESELRFVMPPAVIGDEALEAAWTTQIASALDGYAATVDQLMARYRWVDDKVQRRKMAREAAQAVMPGSTESRIVVTGNARAWRTMLELCAGETAEQEMRRLAIAVLRVLSAEAPAFFSDFTVYVAADRREAARAEYHKV
jgi:thymidylate synthase (FAD)